MLVANWLACVSRRLTNCSVWNGGQCRVRRSRGRRSTSGTTQTESLEVRQLLSGAPVPVGSETQVNTFTTGAQQNPSIAADAAGDYVVVWTSYNQASSTSGDDIYAQRYNSAGVAQGGEFLVNVNTANNQIHPKVAMDQSGDFVVTWQSYDQVAAGSLYDIYARVYNSSGVAQGTEFQVNTYTTSQQKTPSVAMDSGGDFVIAWSSYNHYSGRGLYAIYAQRYNSAGVAQGNNFEVNQYLLSAAGSPSIAMDSSGDFVVAWSAGSHNSDYNSEDNIYARRFNSVGVALDANDFLVNTYTVGQQEGPSVAMDATGDFVIAWFSFSYQTNLSVVGVWARHYNSAGTALDSAEFQIATNVGKENFDPSVAMDAAGDFVVTGHNYRSGTGDHVFAQMFDAAGDGQGSEFEVNTFTSNAQGYPAATMDSAGDLIVAWQSQNEASSTSGYDIYSQRYQNQVNPNSAPTVTSPASTNLATTSVTLGADVTSDGGSPLTTVGVLYAPTSSNTTLQIGVLGTTNLTVTPGTGPFTIDISGLATGVQYSYVAYATNGVSTSYSAASTFTTSITAPTVEFPNSTRFSGTTANFGGYVASDGGAAITQRGIVYSLTSDNSNPQLGGAGVTDVTSAGTTGSFVVNVSDLTPEKSYSYAAYATNSAGTTYTAISTFTTPTQTPVGSETQVNTYTTANQGQPRIASDPAGDYVVVWQSQDQDGSGYGIYAQRFNAAGVPQLSEFRVNTYTTGNQLFPAVAMDSAGDFVITWSSSQNGVNGGIFGQRYNAAGVAQGVEFQVNSTSTIPAGIFAVAMDATGDFVVTWAAKNEAGISSGYDIYAQRFDSSGNAEGSQFLVNTYTTLQQQLPSIAMDAAGDFVIAWTSDPEVTRGSGSDIYVQQYNSAGVAHGGELLVNTETPYSQFDPSVAMDSTGAFVVEWREGHLQNGSVIYGISAQRFDATGVAQGSEIHVDDFTTVGQNLASVAIDQSGDFVITWTSYDSSFYGVYAQLFNSTGVAQGGEFEVNTYTPFGQDASTVAMDSTGNFVIAWQSNGEDGDGYGVFSQRYQPNFQTSPTVTTPTVANITGTTATLGGNVVTDGKIPLSEVGVLYSLTSTNSNPQLGGAGVTNVTGTAETGVFALDISGLTQGAGYSFVAYATNSLGTTYTSPVSTFTTLANQAPSGTSTTVATLENTPYVFSASDFGFTDPNDNPPNALKAVEITTLPSVGSLTDNGTAVTAGQFVPVADINGGLLIFTPDTFASGANYASFTFQVQDDGGTVGGGIDTDPSPKSMTINVTHVNQAPVGTTSTVTVGENVGYSIKTFDFGFTDPNDNPANTLLAVKFVLLPNAGTLTDDGVAVTVNQFVSASDISAGQLVFTPNSNLLGGPYFLAKFQVQDNGGTANGGTDLDPTPKILYATIVKVNHAPTGTSGTVTGIENTPYTFKTSDLGYSDPGDNPPNALQAVKFVLLPNSGTLTDNGVAVTLNQFVSAADITGGKLNFTPANNLVGGPYFLCKFQVQDNGGTANGGVNLDPNPKILDVNITRINHAPAGTSGTVAGLENTPYRFKSADFGFTDPNDSPPNTLAAVKFVLLPNSGTLTDNGVAVALNQFVSAADISSGKLIFTPNTNLFGGPYFLCKFQVQDNGGNANGGVNLDPSPKILDINITHVNQAPIGTSGTVTGLKNTPYTLKSTDFGFTDPNDNPPNSLAAVKFVLLPNSGTITDNGVAITLNQFVSAADINAGKLVFTPAANLIGGPYFLCKFQVQDNGGTANGGVNLDPNPKILDIRIIVAVPLH